MPFTIKLDFDRFITIHVILPILLLLTLFYSLESTGLDLWLGKQFYSTALKEWSFKENWFAETALHTGGRFFIYILASSVLVCLLYSFKSVSVFTRYRKPLCFLLLASIIGPLVISILKNTTHIYCPWNLTDFGGDKPYVRLFDRVDSQLPVGHCFPAAHAGAGFTFISLYFFLTVVKREYNRYGLYFGLVLGLFFGFAQQVRGAHFLSHDVFALSIDWFSSLVVFILFFRKQIKWV